jgi:hypothetical protein
MRMKQLIILEYWTMIPDDGDCLDFLGRPERFESMISMLRHIHLTGGQMSSQALHFRNEDGPYRKLFCHTAFSTSQMQRSYGSVIHIASANVRALTMTF